ncbi:hypothetical protein ABZ490_42015 [Streptomyces sp. NPDC005811]|uniref:hypothetical protein n=1 Tax=Streptomyces sp. NPDC005811 TaxID=3154565 RepID=UPI0033E27A25
MTTASTDSSAERVPGRAWTVRLTGHGDRSATLTCSTTACRMPQRSKDLASLRSFAAQHAAAHAKAATVRPNARCHCGSTECAPHESRVRCAGTVVMILRHDVTVGQVWSVEEVCTMCAPLIPHATVVARAARPHHQTEQATGPVPAPARPVVPGGFSSPTAGPEDRPAPARRSHRPGQGPRRRPNQGR